MSALRLLVTFAALSVLSAADRTDSAGAFLVQPYIQLGDQPKLLKKERLTVMWHAPDREGDWAVEYRRQGSSKWEKAAASILRTPAAKNVPAHRVVGAELRDLPPGKPVAYRVLWNGAPVFESTATARKSAKQSYRFVVTGDCAQNSPAQKAVAYQMHRASPDFVAIAGDIVYGRGLMSEYREKYWPVYNADTADQATGAPLLRSTLFVAAPGNHDVGGANLNAYPDGLAYYLYWAQPLNGPLAPADTNGAPPLAGPAPQLEEFRKSAGAQYPRMGSFSFDYGNSHWVMLDSNFYADWNSGALRAWLQKDLAAASKARWRFVVYHHPGFNSSQAHFKDQWMRLLAPVFEKGKVDIVFAGHVHNYQRSYPLTFLPDQPDTWRGEVSGKWTLDRSFDGDRTTRASGVVYLVTGAGGAKLYNPEQHGKPSSWQEFTTRFVSNINSMTQVDAEDRRLTVRQIDTNGAEVDRFVLTR